MGREYDEMIFELNLGETQNKNLSGAILTSTFWKLASLILIVQNNRTANNNKKKVIVSCCPRRSLDEEEKNGEEFIEEEKNGNICEIGITTNSHHQSKTKQYYNQKKIF